jgi:hypothetical protein
MNEAGKRALGLEKASNEVDTTKEEERMRRLTERIIGCAIEVHREPGPKLLKTRMDVLYLGNRQCGEKASHRDTETQS